MMVRYRSLILSIMLGVFLLFGAYPSTAAAEDKKAPDFTLPDISGKKVSLSDYKGKVIVLNFWATWCGPCRAEMPSLNRLYLELKDKGLVVLAASIDTSEKPVQAFVTEKKLVFPVLMDKDKEVYFDKYTAFGLPATFLISRNGTIAEKILGEHVWDSAEMKAGILKLLNSR